MERIRKILAVVLTLSMIMGMSTMAFAAGGKPSASDKGTVQVENVEKTATVTAYQIVSANYNDQGFTGYQVVRPGSISAANFQPTSDEIAALAKNTSGLVGKRLSTTGTADLATFTGDLEAGYWMVLVTGTVTEVYNPMLVGVYYSVDGSDNTVVSGNVNANTEWTLVTEGAYAKSTAPTIDKEIVNPSSNNSNGDDVAIGDNVDFKISTKIPSYSAEYNTVQVKIKDRLSTGLSLNTDTIAVTVSGALVAASDATYSIVSDNSRFEISFNSAYAIQNGGKDVVVTYTAELTSEAALNFDPNTNTATLIYSNDPGNSNKTQSANDTTYTYTFAIDSELYGSYDISGNRVTNEIFKTGEKRTTISSDGITEVETTTLSGAEFTLTRTDVANGRAQTKTTDDNGKLKFTGLDAGTYELVETKAPNGYSLNNEKHTVVISANYNTDGTLADYSITIDGTHTNEYKATYKGDTIVKTVEEITIDKSQEFEIKNTKLTSLPSTGGIGTTIFTIVGCIVMIGAAAMFFASRRKSAAEK